MCLWNIWGWEGDGKGKGDKVGKGISCRTRALLSISPQFQSNDCFLSLLGKRVELLRTWVSHLSQHLWCPEQCSLCREELWAQKCLLTSPALPHAQGSQPFRNRWAEILYKLLSLPAPWEGQEGHSSAGVYEQSLFPLKYLQCSSHRGKQWNEGKSGSDLGLIRLFRERQGHNPSWKPISFPSNWESQPVHKLQVTEQKVELEAHSSWLFCI